MKTIFALLCLAAVLPAAYGAPPVCDRVRFVPRAGHAARMVGGRFQGSNSGPTSGFTDLAQIAQSPPEGRWTELAFANRTPYRWLRYYAPPGSYGNVAEIEFDHGAAKIAGVVYGTAPAPGHTDTTFLQALDGDPNTYFDGPLADEQYVGIDTGGSAAAPPEVAGAGFRHYHIGNSLTDTEGEFAQAIAQSAGNTHDFFDRSTIPGAPLRWNWEHGGHAFGTPDFHDGFVHDAPLDALVLQAFLDNGDSDDPTYSVLFYDLARQKSPRVKAWIYGQWPSTGTGEASSGAADWEARARAYMDVYVAHDLNFQAARPAAPVSLIPGGLALIHLKQAIEAGQIPGLSRNFFAETFADSLHLNANGRYFVGLVHYACFYGRSPVGLPVVAAAGQTPTLTPAQARAYQQIAWDAVTQFQKAPARFVGAAVPAELDARASVGQTGPFSNPAVRFIAKDSTFDYLIAAPRLELYRLKISAVATQPGMAIDVLLNGKPVGSPVVPVSADGAPADTEPLPLVLRPGLNLLRLHVPTERPYDINSLVITDGAGRGVAHRLPAMGGFSFFSQVTVKPGEAFTQSFTVSDPAAAPETLQVSAASDNPALVSPAAITLTRDPKNPRAYSFTVTPAAGQTGQATITFTVINPAGLRRATAFTLIVKPATVSGDHL